MRMGDRIRRERQRLGLSQREFADRAGITFQMASLYENDHRTPRIETLSSDSPGTRAARSPNPRGP